MAKESFGWRLPLAPPQYTQVRATLIHQIDKGEFKPGASLPSKARLAAQFEVSVDTVRRAMEGLEKSGIVVQVKGGGHYVSEEGTLAVMHRFSALRDAHGHRLPVKRELVDVSRRPATLSEQVRFFRTDGVEVYVIQQVVYAEESQVKVGVERSIVPVDLLPELDTILAGSENLYALLAARGALVTRVVERVLGKTADAGTASILGTSQGRQVLVVNRSTFDLKGPPIEMRTGTYLADEVSVRLETDHINLRQILGR
jgi:GntR family transcriptional regulator